MSVSSLALDEFLVSEPCTSSAHKQSFFPHMLDMESPALESKE